MVSLPWIAQQMLVPLEVNLIAYSCSFRWNPSAIDTIVLLLDTIARAG